MAAALIRLTKRLIITDETTDAILKELWRLTSEDLMRMLKTRGLKIDSANYNSQLATSINEEMTEYGDAIFKRVKRKIPGSTKLSAESKLTVVSSKAEVLEADPQNPTGYKIIYYLTTDVLTYLDNVNDFIVIGMGDQSEKVKKREMIETITLKLHDDLYISEYISIAIE